MHLGAFGDYSFIFQKGNALAMSQGILDIVARVKYLIQAAMSATA